MARNSYNQLTANQPNAYAVDLGALPLHVRSPYELLAEQRKHAARAALASPAVLAAVDVDPATVEASKGAQLAQAALDESQRGAASVAQGTQEVVQTLFEATPAENPPTLQLEQPQLDDDVITMQMYPLPETPNAPFASAVSHGAFNPAQLQYLRTEFARAA